MTYQTFEESTAGGSPFELIRFSRAGQLWGFTTKEEAVSFGGLVYEPEVITRSALQQNNEDGTMSVEITLPRDNDFVAQFIGASAPTPVQVTLFRNHRGELLTETVTIFLGDVTSTAFRASQAVLFCTSLESVFALPIARVHIQRTCPWMLYDNDCGVDIGTFTHAGTIDAVSTADPRVLTLAGVPNIGGGSTYYQNGVLEVGAQKRLIVAQDADEVTVFVPFNPQVVAGATCDAIAGCDRTTGAAGCTRFSNLPRFGGFTIIPLRNPWERLI